MLKFLFILLFSNQASAFIDFVSKGVDSIQNLEIYTDAALDLADSIDDESSINGSVSKAGGRLRDIKNGLREIDYTAQDIKALVDSEDLDSGNITENLHRVANRIRRGKSLLRRLTLLAGADPAAVSAGENIKSTGILKDIHMELVKARADRQFERQTLFKEKIEQKKIEKQQHEFLVSQLELMQRKSSSGSLAYSKINVKDNSKPRGL